MFNRRITLPRSRETKLYIDRHVIIITITRALEECRFPPRHIIITTSNWKNPDYLSLYPDSDPDHSQNLMGSELQQDPSSNFSEVSTNSIC